MVDSNRQIVPPDINQDDIPYIQRSNMTEESTPVEESTESNRGGYEWLKLIIFVGAILLISYLAISVISPILFRDYVPDIMGLDQTSSVTEPIMPSVEEPAEESEASESESEESIDQAGTTEGTNESESASEPADEMAEEAAEQEADEAEPLPAEENQPAKTDSESQPETQPETTTYTVQIGETLTSIAAAYDITVEELMAMNELVNPNFLYVGQEINVPK